MTGTAVLGIDAGGTETRAVAARLDGLRLGHGSGGRGNAATPEPDVSVGTVLSAARIALTGLDPASIAYVIVSAAGWAGLQERRTAGELARGWTRLGLRCPVEIVGDVVAMFAAGTAEPAGHVLVSGTGAVAAELADRAVLRTSDGLGWLLGDAGSAFWIGRTAARDTLAAVEGQQPETTLTRLVVESLCPDRTVVGTARAGAVVAAIYGRPPLELAELAPLVCAAAGWGDPQAERILTDAADHLVATLAGIRGPDAESAIVLGGGCLLGSARLGRAVRQRVQDRWPAAAVSAATDAAGGAAWLAARRAGAPDPPRRPFVRRY